METILRKSAKSIYITPSYEGFLQKIYGRDGRAVRSGVTNLSLFKKSLIKVFSTFSKAALRNINGDDKHRSKIIEKCKIAINKIKNCTSIDNLAQIAFVCNSDIVFSLLGHAPTNSKKSKTDWRETTVLSKYRTLYYGRTASQKVDQIMEYAYRTNDEHEGSLFQKLIKIKKSIPNDDEALLAWIRENESEVYSIFN